MRKHPLSVSFVNLRLNLLHMYLFIVLWFGRFELAYCSGGDRFGWCLVRLSACCIGGMVPAS